ncbi:MAG TPA: hypothetical protein VGD67_09020, partial [Pseudonocardiaceae bacterium]
TALGGAAYVLSRRPQEGRAIPSTTTPRALESAATPATPAMNGRVPTSAVAGAEAPAERPKPTVVPDVQDTPPAGTVDAEAEPKPKPARTRPAATKPRPKNGGKSEGDAASA